MLPALLMRTSKWSNSSVTEVAAAAMEALSVKSSRTKKVVDGKLAAWSSESAVWPRSREREPITMW
jgi:hypothetical protein